MTAAVATASSYSDVLDVFFFFFLGKGYVRDQQKVWAKVEIVKVAGGG